MSSTRAGYSIDQALPLMASLAPPVRVTACGPPVGQGCQCRHAKICESIAPLRLAKSGVALALGLQASRHDS